MVEERSIRFEEPPDIREVKPLTEYIVYVLVGLCAAVQVGLLFSVLKYRNDSIMKLSQVYFLVTLQVAGVVATVSTIFFNPRSDWFCRLSSPMTLIPLQLMMAIMIGRLHRILVIMSPLLAWRQDKPNKKMLHLDLKRWSQTFMTHVNHINPINMLPGGVNLPNLQNIPIAGKVAGKAISLSSSIYSEVQVQKKTAWAWIQNNLLCCFYARKSSGLRQEYSATQLNLLIFAVTFPIVVIETVGMIFFDPVLTLHLNEDNSVGMCHVFAS